MMFYHDFQIGLSQYASLGKQNLMPELNCCPMCRARNRLVRHGFYERNAIEDEMVVRIPICRLLCPDCRKTVSILPTFLLPYFQHTTAFIIRILLEFWMNAILLCTRQLRRFYERRTIDKLTEMELFFREEDHFSVLPTGPKERTIKLLQMIQALGKATFVRRWWRHRINSFMAASVYHGTRVVKTE